MSKRAQSKGWGTILGTYPLGSAGVTKSIARHWGMPPQPAAMFSLILFRKQLILEDFAENRTDWYRFENDVTPMTSQKTMEYIADDSVMHQNAQSPLARIEREPMHGLHSS
ncbi:MULTISPECIES: hypothetical protein [unclassified Comamonas]|uniref:hypothetical protein n=1 Tax=unclassified Comamonas TaxID=2638500 RepID=UPI0011DD7DA2|nr:hypothetical protein [Comamonas sp. B-9]